MMIMTDNLSEYKINKRLYSGRLKRVESTSEVENEIGVTSKTKTKIA